MFDRGTHHDTITTNSEEDTSIHLSRNDTVYRFEVDQFHCLLRFSKVPTSFAMAVSVDVMCQVVLLALSLTVEYKIFVI